MERRTFVFLLDINQLFIFNKRGQSADSLVSNRLVQWINEAPFPPLGDNLASERRSKINQMAGV
jgi:hypothetical protein